MFQTVLIVLTYLWLKVLPVPNHQIYIIMKNIKILSSLEMIGQILKYNSEKKIRMYANGKLSDSDKFYLRYNKNKFHYLKYIFIEWDGHYKNNIQEN